MVVFIFLAITLTVLAQIIVPALALPPAPVAKYDPLLANKNKDKDKNKDGTNSNTNNNPMAINTADFNRYFSFPSIPSSNLSPLSVNEHPLAHNGGYSSSNRDLLAHLSLTLLGTPPPPPTMDADVDEKIYVQIYDIPVSSHLPTLRCAAYYDFDSVDRKTFNEDKFEYFESTTSRALKRAFGSSVNSKRRASNDSPSPTDTDTEYSSSATAVAKSTPLEPSTDDLANLISSLHLALTSEPFPCQILHSGWWWSYEWCHEKRIRQFHVEVAQVKSKGKDKKAEITKTVRQIINLGDFKTRRIAIDDAMVFPKASDVKVLDTFENGDVCENELLRKTRVKYTCCESLVKFESISEVRMCEYEANVCTSLLCSASATSASASDEDGIVVNKAGVNKNSIRSILNHALANICLQHNYGWWTYEFCKNRKAHQFHVHAVNDPKTGKPKVEYEVDNLLGSVIADADYVDEEEHLHVVGVAVGSGATVSVQGVHFVEEMIDGDVCIEKEVSSSTVVKGGVNSGVAITRSATIKYYCGPILSLLSVQEDASCHYVLSVSIPELCEHVLFKEKEQERLIVKCEFLIEADNNDNDNDVGDEDETETEETRAEKEAEADFEGEEDENSNSAAEMEIKTSRAEAPDSEAGSSAYHRKKHHQRLKVEYTLFPEEKDKLRDNSESIKSLLLADDRAKNEAYDAHRHYNEMSKLAKEAKQSVIEHHAVISRARESEDEDAILRLYGAKSRWLQAEVESAQSLLEEAKKRKRVKAGIFKRYHSGVGGSIKKLQVDSEEINEAAEERAYMKKLAMKTDAKIEVGVRVHPVEVEEVEVEVQTDGTATTM